MLRKINFFWEVIAYLLNMRVVVLTEMVLKSFYAVAASLLNNLVRMVDFVRVNCEILDDAYGVASQHNCRDLLSFGAVRALVMI